jgi:GrpB-like predicted nucleotidyltransferase (UPF0157 family)
VLVEDESHVASLLVYGQLMLLDEADALEEAMKVALRLVAAQPRDRDVRRFFCTVLKKSPTAVDKLLEMLGKGKDQPKSLAFLSNVAKEYSAVAAAVELSRRAANADPESTTYALNLVHLLEIDRKNKEARDVIRSWLKSNPNFAVGSLVAKHVLAAWDNPEVEGVFVMHDSSEKGIPKLSSSELDFMAMLFVLVKLLYLENDVGSVASIVTLIELERNGWEFHLTSVRNEHAYYCCAVQCLQNQTVNVGRQYRRVVHVIGDSHCLPIAWNTYAENVLLKPHLVTGCKMWHLRPESVRNHSFVLTII